MVVHSSYYTKKYDSTQYIKLNLTKKIKPGKAFDVSGCQRSGTSAGHIRNGILTLEEGRSFSVRFEEGEMLLDTDAGADEPMIFERLVDAFDLDFPFEYEE